jgi:hypothetical protein
MTDATSAAPEDAESAEDPLRVHTEEPAEGPESAVGGEPGDSLREHAETPTDDD